MKKLNRVFLGAFFSWPSFAAPTWYELAKPQQDNHSIRFSIGYTLGTHDGWVGEAKGKMLLDLSAKEVLQGNFVIPILSLETGDRKKDCHLRETMGLDYARSEYPGRHVCNQENNLPTEGKDAISFPHISFTFGKSTTYTANGKMDGFKLAGQWSIHGVQREAKPIIIFLNPEDKEEKVLGLRSSFAMRLEDFQIIVKKFLFISVDEEARVEVEGKLIRK